MNAAVNRTIELLGPGDWQSRMTAEQEAVSRGNLSREAERSSSGPMVPFWPLRAAPHQGTMNEPLRTMNEHQSLRSPPALPRTSNSFYTALRLRKAWSNGTRVPMLSSVVRYTWPAKRSMSGAETASIASDTMACHSGGLAVACRNGTTTGEVNGMNEVIVTTIVSGFASDDIAMP